MPGSGDGRRRVGEPAGRRPIAPRPTRKDQSAEARGARGGRASSVARPRGLRPPSPIFAGLVALGEAIRPDPIPNSAVKRLSANGTMSQDMGESVAARPAKIGSTDSRQQTTGHEPTPPPQRRPRFEPSLFPTTGNPHRATAHHPCRPPMSSPRPQIAAGWSSPVARQAHNLKAAGSNPAPATNS